MFGLFISLQIINLKIEFMKRIFLTLAIFIPILLFAQKSDPIADLEQYKDMYTVDGTNVVFTKVIENIPGTKDEIYSRVISYFATAYNSANNVIQQQDKDAGVVIGKGIFPDIYQEKVFLSVIPCDCRHTIRIDIKDGRVRVVISANQYIYNSIQNLNIIDLYPLNEKQKVNKKFYANLFIALCQTVDLTFSNIEKSLKNELPTTNENW